MWEYSEVDDHNNIAHEEGRSWRRRRRGAFCANDWYQYFLPVGSVPLRLPFCWNIVCEDIGLVDISFIYDTLPTTDEHRMLIINLRSGTQFSVNTLYTLFGKIGSLFISLPAIQSIFFFIQSLLLMYHLDIRLQQLLLSNNLTNTFMIREDALYSEHSSKEYFAKTG